jgi:putative tributyrin esterase
VHRRFIRSFSSSIAFSLALVLLHVAAPWAGSDQAPVASPAASRPGVSGGVSLRDEAFQSKALGRELRYRVALPAGYDEGSRRYPVLYLLHGFTGSEIDWGNRTELLDRLRAYDLIVVMPDGRNSWYVDAADSPGERFETAIGTELVEEVDRRFRTIAARYGRAIAGLSMGGYGALKFGLKTPGRFALAASFSGALAAAAASEEWASLSASVATSLDTVFGPAGSATRAENELFALAGRVEPGRLPFLYFDCGAEDRLLESNRAFAAILQKRNIPYEYREVPGAHTWDYWNRQLPQLLEVMRERMPVVRRAGS